MGKKILSKIPKEDLKKTFKSDLFLQEFSIQLQELFTEKEILQLLNIYPKKVQKSADLNFFTTEITEHTEKKLSPKSTNSIL